MREPRQKYQTVWRYHKGRLVKERVLVTPCCPVVTLPQTLMVTLSDGKGQAKK